MGDNYEDFVELGFEGIDRFANKYHDVVYGYADKTRRKGFGHHRGHGQHHHPQDVGAPPPPPPPPPPVDVNAPIPPPPPFQAPPQPYGDEEEWQNVEKQRAMSDPRIRCAGPVPIPVPSPMAGASAGQGPGGDFGPKVEPPPSPWGIRGGNEALPRGPQSPQHRERGYDRRSRERKPPLDEDDEEEKAYWATERERPRPRRRRSPSWSPPRRRSEPRYDEPPPPRRREVRSKSISRSKSKSPSRGLGSGAEATVAAVLAGGIVALGARGVVELYDRRQERKARGSRQRERRRSVW